MSSLKLSFLGTFQVSWQGQAITRFRTDKTRALLVYLAMEGGRPHRREALATLLWPEHTRTAGLGNLRKSLHRLREALDQTDEGLSERVLQVTRGDVLWRGDDVWLDTAVFTASSDPAHDHIELATCSHCLQKKDEAVTLYHGELLPGFNLPDAVEFDHWLSGRRQQLQQRMITLLNDLLMISLTKGAYEQAMHYGRRYQQLEPWDEKPYLGMMQACLAQGDRAEGVALYEQCVQALADELGLAPSAELTALYQSVLTDEVAVKASSPLIVSLHHFPTSWAPFVGREQELATLRELLLRKACRLLTLLGLGGAGKTRLSQQLVFHLQAHDPEFVADCLRDGCYYVSLGEATAESQMVALLAQSLHIQPQKELSLRQQVFAFLKGKSILLVLDNLEQLVEAAAPLVADLLAHSPHLKIVATSRQPLQIQAEWQFPLDGLTYPLQAELDAPQSYAAGALFLQVAQRVRPGFQPDAADQQAIGQICQQADGSPLALEMAASWIRLLDCRAIADRMARDLDFLASGLRDLPERHQSLQAIFSYSWEILPQAGRETLSKLTVFRGGFDVAGVTAVAAVSLADLVLLLDHFIVRQIGEARYDFHPLLRQFVNEQADRSLAQTVETAHRRYYLNLLSDLPNSLLGDGASLALQQLQADWDNILYAWDEAIFSEDLALLRLAAPGMAAYGLASSFLQQAEEAFAAAIEALLLLSPDTPDWEFTRVVLLWQYAQLSLENHPRIAYDLLESVHDSVVLQQDLMLHCQIAADWGIAHWRIGEAELAHQLLNEALQLAKHRKYRQVVPFIQHHLGNVYISLEDWDGAKRFLSAAATGSRRNGNLFLLAGVLNDLGLLMLILEKAEQCLPYMHESLDIYQQLGHQISIVRGLSNITYVYLAIGSYDQARLYGEEIFSYGWHIFSASAYVNLAHVYLKQGNLVAAATKYATAVELANEFESFRMFQGALAGLMQVGARRKMTRWVVKLWGVFEQIEQRLGHLRSLDQLERSFVDEALESVRSTLSERGFEECRQIGLAISLDELVLQVKYEASRNLRVSLDENSI